MSFPHRIFLVLLLILGSFPGLIAQDLHLVTQSDGEVVRLRWSFQQVADWELANAHGYTISRMAQRVNG